MDENLKRLYVYLECAKHNAFAKTVAAVRIYTKDFAELRIPIGIHNTAGMENK